MTTVNGRRYPNRKQGFARATLRHATERRQADHQFELRIVTGIYGWRSCAIYLSYTELQDFVAGAEHLLAQTAPKDATPPAKAKPAKAPHPVNPQLALDLDAAPAPVFGQIAHYDTWEAGGGIMVDVLLLNDDTVIGISDDLICLYPVGDLNLQEKPLGRIERPHAASFYPFNLAAKWSPVAGLTYVSHGVSEPSQLEWQDPGPFDSCLLNDGTILVVGARKINLFGAGAENGHNTIVRPAS
jgi:hypothetical protein